MERERKREKKSPKSKQASPLGMGHAVLFLHIPLLQALLKLTQAVHTGAL